jgi:hypothetical protein
MGIALVALFGGAEAAQGDECAPTAQPPGGSSEGASDPPGGNAGDPNTPLAEDGLPPLRIAELALAAGFTGDEVPVAVAVALAESRGRPNADNTGLNQDGSVDYGLWQINNNAHGPSGFDPGRAFDVHYNAMWARRIYERAGGWKPWTTYNKGAHEEHMAVAQAAAATATPQDADVTAIAALRAESTDGAPGAQPAGANCAPAAAQLINTGFPAEIDPYQPSDSQDTCDPAAKPGVTYFKDLLLAAYPKVTWGIDRSCSADWPSEHIEGRALDWGVNITNPQQAAAAEDVIAKLLATDEHGNRHALFRRFGLMYIIWNDRIITSTAMKANPSANLDDLWADYRQCTPGVSSPNVCHTNHMHFSFSWAGANMQTTWWTLGPPPGALLGADPPAAAAPAAGAPAGPQP